MQRIRVTGYVALAGQIQWAPTRTAHDPNPPIPIESPSGADTPVAGAFSGVGTAAFTLQKGLVRTLAFAGVGTLGLTKAQVLSKAFGYSGVGTEIVTRQTARLKTFSYAAAGTTTFSRLATHLQTFVYSATGVSTLTDVIGFLVTKTFTAVATLVTDAVFGGGGAEPGGPGFRRTMKGYLGRFFGPEK